MRFSHIGQESPDTPFHRHHDGYMNDDFPILAAVAATDASDALLEHLSGLGLHVTRSTLYRRVEALVAQGWLDADDIRGENGHYRRALTISKAGRARVEKEATEALRVEPLESPLFALAVAVAGREGPESLAAMLRPRMAVAGRRLTDEERSLRETAPDEWTRAARERRIAHLQTDIAWLQGLMGRRVVEQTAGRVLRAG